MHDTETVYARIEERSDAILGELLDYLRIPSVSTDPEYAGEVRRCAEFLLEKMNSAGLEARIIESERGGHPMLFGEWLGAPGAPTLLFYGHYDVQPPDPLEEWRNPPFEPTLEEGLHGGQQVVARGATDDKGQSYAHLAAVAAMLAVRGSLPINVKFLVEGEEECGGETIEDFVNGAGDDSERAALLACDAVIVSDSSMYAPGQPSLLYGLKGLLYTEITIEGPNRDLHSGTFGGAVTNPLNALGHIIDKLRNAETGVVQIPGFYDAVRPLETWEREGFAELPFDEQQYRDALGIDTTFGEEGYTTLERAWARPTCDVNGIWGGYQGAGAKTVIPASGGAKVSMRLVPDQDPKVIAQELQAYVDEVTPAGAKAKVEVLSAADPVLVEVEVPLAEAALDAMEDVWGKRPVKIREGGSIPIVTTFAQVLHVPVLLLGFGLSDDRLHSPNEKMDVDYFFAGIRFTARLLDRVAAASGSGAGE